MLTPVSIARSGYIASGNVSWPHHASGAVRSGHLSDGSTSSGNLSSGSVGSPHIAAAAVKSGHLSSGSVDEYALMSGVQSFGIKRVYVTEEAMSGVLAVALGRSGGGFSIVRAERQSGLRMPAIGVVYSGALSGQSCEVCILGTVYVTHSGGIASGFHGNPLYVGSGGLIVNLSGFCAGASSGPGVGTFSGSYIQMLGQSVSGGIYVQVDTTIRLAIQSGAYLSALWVSGAPARMSYPVSGFF